MDKRRTAVVIPEDVYFYSVGCVYKAETGRVYPLQRESDHEIAEDLETGGVALAEIDGEWIGALDEEDEHAFINLIN